MADESAMLRAILDELKGIHALLRKIDRRQWTPEEAAENEGAEIETRQSLAARLERAHRVKPATREGD